MPDTSVIGDGRPRRFCPACEQVDDHPRHVIEDGGDPKVALHMDCCRARGCPDGTCDIITAGAESLRGAKLLAHIQGLDHAPDGAIARKLAAHQATEPVQARLATFRHPAADGGQA